MIKINIDKKIHHKGFNNMFIKGIDEINKNKFVSNILLNFKEQSKINNFVYSSEIEKSLEKYPYKENDDILFKINDYEIFELSRLKKNEIFRYLAYRYKYKVYPLLKLQDNYPPCVQIEPTSKCNFRCIMCNNWQ